MLWTKRAQFILVSLLLSLGLLATQFITYSWRYQAILALVFLTYILSAWVLHEELQGSEWLTCLILPCVYTAAVAMFYFLLPEKTLTRVIILVAFATGMYAILLTENIFSIASVKTIQLLRAAQAVGFLMSLVTAFFLYGTIFSFRLAPPWNFVTVLGFSIPLYFQSVWSSLLKKEIDKIVIIYSFSLSFLTAELALVLSFWPLSLLLTALTLVTFFYSTLGLLQHYLSGRLFEKTIREYLEIGLVVLIILFLMAGWGGR